jgi:hypothetical protein
MLFLKQLFQVVFILNAYKFSYVQSKDVCPEPPDDPNFPCVPIKSWDNFVTTVTKSDSQGVVLCQFNIHKPPSAKPLIIAKPVTVVCLEAGKCIINAASNHERGILKLKNLAKVSIYGLVFKSSGLNFNGSSAVHVKFLTPMKQMFCSCIFQG